MGHIAIAAAGAAALVLGAIWHPMNYIAVAAAAAAVFVFGAIWYSALSGPWMKAIGLSEEDIKNTPKTIYLVPAATSLVLAAMMDYVFTMAGVRGLASGLVWGLSIGAFLMTPWILNNYVFGQRDPGLYRTDIPHAVLSMGVIGLVLGAVSPGSG